VLFVLVLFAALVVPNLISMRQGQQTRAAYGQIMDLISEARLSSVGGDSTYAITWDSGTSQFDLKKEPPNQQDASSNSAIPQPEARPMQTTTSVDQFDQVKALSIPPALKPDTFRAGTSTSDPSSWAIHFYPDGTSDGGGFQISAGSNIQSVLVDKYGLGTLQPGQLPDTTDQVWTAGSYAQKI
jgi:hypothetical protein